MKRYCKLISAYIMYPSFGLRDLTPALITCTHVTCVISRLSAYLMVRLSIGYK